MTDLSAYRSLIARKRVAFKPHGLDTVPALHPALRPDQRHCVEFALRSGCSAQFLGTGMGKTFTSLEFGRVVVEQTRRPVLMLAPLAVGHQHVREAERFGIDAQVVRSQEEVGARRIYVTNYERLDAFDVDRFGGVVLDESSILKNFTGKTTRKLTSAFARTPFRLACTATPAPNDHTELGQHAAFLGVMDAPEMLSRWFIADQAQMGRYRLKRAAVNSFWEWVASWARCATRPSDLGFSDEGFVLPPLEVFQHEVSANRYVDQGEERDGQGRLFRIPEMSATSIHKEKRMTCAARAKLAASIVLGGESWLGSQNTQLVEEISINPTLKSEIDVESKAESPTKTELTCRNTISKTKASSEGRRSNKRLTTPIEEPNTPLTPPSGSAPKSRHETSALLQNEMADCAPPMASETVSTIVCSPNSKERVLSAERREATNGAESSSLITATPQVASGVSCVSPATTDLGSSSTVQKTCDEQHPTSNNEEWWVVWCDTDYEQEALEVEFASKAISIKGSHSAEQKERLHEAWLRGDKKILITKSVMFGFGLNWQHCARQCFAGLSFSYEAYHQAVRRCWRFGQTRTVRVHVVCADTEAAIKAVVDRKGEDHDAMGRAMAAAMRRASITSEVYQAYRPQKEAALPAWLAA